MLPAAFLAGWFFPGVGHFLLSMLGVDLRGPVYPEFLFPFQQLLPGGVAFVLVGAWVAPGRRNVVALSLAGWCILMSVLTHIVVQSNPGLTNYMHSCGESLGAVLGVGLVHYLEVRRRDRATASAGAD